jgi:hypothetical protein
MIIHHDSEPFIRWVHGRALGNGPGFEDPGDLQPEIVMETGRMMFMNDESHPCPFFPLSLKKRNPHCLSLKSYSIFSSIF